MRMSARLSVPTLVAVLASVLLLSPAIASDKYEKDEAVKLDPLRKPAAGKALIYFARTQVMGAAVKVKLYADGKFIGILASKTFIPFECEPGQHTFAVVAENAGLLDATVEAGRVYVVQTSIHMGGIKARTHFEVARKVSEALDEFLKAKSDLVGIKTTAEGLTWVEEEAQNDKVKMEKYRGKGEVETLVPGDGTETLP